MLRTVLGRVGVFALSLLGASLVIFLICQALPGDPARILLGDGATAEQIAAKAHELGTDVPAPLRYLTWVGGLVRGDLGRSYASGVPVASLVGPRLPVTASLAGVSLLVSALAALPLGMIAALRRRHASGFAITTASQLGMAIPAFWAGIVLSIVVGVRLRWLPPNGYVPLTSDPVGWASHLMLPVLSLALVQTAVLVRYVRSAFVEVLGEDYYRTARAIGWREWPALWRHGVRNAALNLVTVLGLQLASILVGAIVVEQVFVQPGLGSLLLQAVAAKDVMVIQGVVMVLVCAVLTINLVVELSYVLIDPRLREGA